MAASQIIPQELAITGSVVTYEAANVDGNFFANDGETSLRFGNASVSDIVVTIPSKKNCSQGYKHDIAITVASGTEVELKALPVGYYNDATGNVNMTYSDVTSLTVAAVKA